MAEDKDWSPESEEDPLKIQKEQLQIGKEFLAMAKAEQEKMRQRAAEEPPARGFLVAEPPQPPSFEEVSAALTKCWEEAKKAVPDAPDHVKVIAFQALLSTTHRYGF